MEAAELYRRAMMVLENTAGHEHPRLADIAQRYRGALEKSVASTRGIGELTANCRKSVAVWPERLECMDEFPMTPSGEVQKFRLRELLTARELVSAE